MATSRGRSSIARWFLTAAAVGALLYLGLARRSTTPTSAAAIPGAQSSAITTAIAEAPQQLRVRVLSSSAHDPGAYTQGLVWDDGDLIESTGGYGRSLLRRWRPGDLEPIKERRLPPHLFGEGLALVGEHLIQLTWREHLALVYDRRTFSELERFDYRGEGWGLAFDGAHLVMSNGSARLEFRDPRTFAVLRRIDVQVAGRALEGLNELEYAEGWIYANVYETEWIARIDPADGQVAAMIDASGLLDRRRWPDAEVLNGIAYSPSSESFFLTGKLWPRVFEVVFE